MNRSDNKKNKMNIKRVKRMSGIRFTNSMKKRLAIQFLLIGLAFVGIFARVIYLSTVNYENYTKIVLNKATYNSRTILFKRGDIVDSKGTVLATSVRVYNVILDPQMVHQYTDSVKEKTIESLKENLWDIFEIEPEVVDEMLEERAHSAYVRLKLKVDYTTAKAYDERDNDSKEYPYLNGVWLEEDYVRTYPYDTLASNILGYANGDNMGIGGVEQSYNSTLNGVDGRQFGYFSDASANTVVREPINGNTVVTTLDQTLQGIVEKHVLAFNEKYKNNATDGQGSKNTSVIMTDPNTGAILANVTYPNYDLNNPSDLSSYFTETELDEMSMEEQSEKVNEMRTNYATSATYEAGSTIKPFTVAAALESGVINGTERYYCSGSLEIGGYTIRCADRDGHGWLNVEESLAYSCNVAMMEMAQEIGIETFTSYQNDFGFGPTTGSDLPNEVATTGLIYTANTMRITDLATNSFGQNFNVTMMQLVAGTAALINGGNYYKPYVVQQIQDSSGSVISNTEPTLVRKIVSESTVDVIRDGMRAVVEYGSGKMAKISDYDIGGKTGTAEKLPRGNGKYLVSFIGGVPINNPEVLIYVLIDEPNVYNQSSGGLATILAGDIMKDALPYLGVTKKE